MAGSNQMIPVVFYQTAAGHQPVREWLLGLDAADRKLIGRDIKAIQQRWPLGMPLCRSLSQGLWEVRSRLPSQRIARVIFAFAAGDMVLLNGFIKKTQKTPQDDIKLAQTRFKEFVK
jgi:phage-related protein